MYARIKVFARFFVKSVFYGDDGMSMFKQMGVVFFLVLVLCFDILTSGVLQAALHSIVGAVHHIYVLTNKILLAIQFFFWRVKCVDTPDVLVHRRCWRIRCTC